MPLLKFFDIKDLRYVVLIGIAIYGAMLYKDNQSLKNDNKRIAENYKQQQRLDSVNYAQKVLDKKEIEDYLTYQNQDLKSQLRSSNIKLNRIEKIINQKFRFQDTIAKRKNISSVVSGIKKAQAITVPFYEKGKCFSVGGTINYDGKDSLKLEINKREFNNNFNYISSWERKPHRWLFGIKTRLFGKKTGKVTILNDCGTSKTIIIDKKK